MTATSEVFRMTISANEILGTLETLSTGVLNADSKSLMQKFRMQAFKIDSGLANPAYVTTGRKKANEITLESLGEESSAALIPGRSYPANSPSTHTKPAGLPADLDADMEAELERLNNEMLASLQGNGNENVILEERRKTPRTTEPSPSGADLFNALSQ